MRSRLLLVHLLVTSLFIVLLGRLWQVQVVDFDRYARAATEDHVRHVVIPAVRGRIVDDRGRPLVRNRTAMTVSVDLSTLSRQPDEGREVLRRLSGLLRVPQEEIARRARLCGPKVGRPCWPGSPYQPIPVAEGVDERTAMQIVERPEDFPGVVAELQPVREYPNGRLAAHVLGYLAPEDRAVVGRDGLEAAYEADLRGTPGSRDLVVDSAGHVLRTLAEQPPTPGATLVTSLDVKVQKAAERALRRAVEAARKRGRVADQAAAVVMEARTGRIVAMANLPSYDPSVWVGGIDPADYARLTSQKRGSPLLSRAVQGQWPPGSTWKVTSTAAAVRYGYRLRGTYDCPGTYRVGDRDFRNYRAVDHGRIDLHRALVVSCDTVFYKFAYDMWLRRPGKKHPMLSMAKAFGFGRKTGVDLPGEAPGHLPDRAWDWPGEAANFSIGQGEILVTPLQLATAYAALANGGTLFSPRVGKALVGADGRVLRKITPPVAGRLPVGAKTLAYTRKALADVPKSGTAAGAFAGFPLDRHPVAGKTGTAEVFGQQDTSWFASFDKRYVVVVMVAQGGNGGETAAPAAREIWSHLYGVSKR
ncbi:penicillin-binding protein 2 [Thermoactinospora rubra]|uniref:penicillin-binding protein 2 n=1 Tax=Thermoactinospora rubra TaxID=1088767 RepID=UPI000A112225|nr:penicillin-binding protein 2 [Thermoactinospora rubra]